MRDDRTSSHRSIRANPFLRDHDGSDANKRRVTNGNSTGQSSPWRMCETPNSAIVVYRGCRIDNHVIRDHRIGLHHRPAKTTVPGPNVDDGSTNEKG